MVNCTPPESQCILLFLRVPELGKVKTRLAADLGPEHTLSLYKRFVRDTLETLHKTGYPVILCVHPAEGAQQARKWLGSDYVFRPQRGKDLGEKMAEAFRHAFSIGCTHALLLGTDVPMITPPVIDMGFENLASRGTVIGPCIDGGYYLIGFRNDTFLPAIFPDMPWGTSRILEITLDRFRDHGQVVHRLPVLQDIDDYQDLQALWAATGEARTTAHRTLKFLDRIIN
ncbi:MAG: TIGR04282 family arsenosugar biosynthesis glycosyltransferase [Deltaproteobacteria bacterium]|nr:TIGR04282 family arsenosugar biosynthesis glycosyltransferase [Deltaproteobacteria bacterium]